MNDLILYHLTAVTTKHLPGFNKIDLKINCLTSDALDTKIYIGHS